MWRKSLSDLGHRQYRARLNPYINPANNEQNVDIGAENDQGVGARPMSPPLLNVVEEPRVIEGTPNAENIDIELLYDMLLNNTNDDRENHVLIGEVMPDNLHEDLNILDDNTENEEHNVFEVAMEPDDSSNDDDNDTSNNADGNGNEPLYNDANITVRESMLTILFIYLKHNLTLSCLEDLIYAIELHCLDEGLKRNSVYKFKNFFGFRKSTHKEHFYCSSCSRNLESSIDTCPTCPRQPNSYFIELPVIDHLKDMYLRKDFYDQLQVRSSSNVVLSNNNSISDIYDGQLYKDWIKNKFLLERNNISLSWYTDGVPVFKSSQISAWPVYLTINELPFEERKKRCNTLLLGLWHGKKKPNFNNFLDSFKPTLRKIAAGITVTLPNATQIVVKGIVLMGVADLPAKSECLNFVQFNARYGCPVCFFEGNVVPLGPRCHLQTYPHTTNIDLRTSERCNTLTANATYENPQFGVRGYTAISRIMPDFIRGFAIDRMHAVDSGVLKKILNLLINKSLRNEPYSLYRNIDEINLRLKQIKPPSFIHRLPRELGDLIHWKASELKHFLFYYSLAIFDGIMEAQFFNHYLLFVMGTYLLSQDVISNHEIDIAEDFLNRFVKKFDVLYSSRYASINVHLLLHLPNAVRELGPLWAHSCYEYENINGEILNVIHGTRYADSQVAQGHHYLMQMMKMIENIQNDDVIEFCRNKKKQVNINARISLHSYSVGVYKILDQIPIEILQALQNAGMTQNNGNSLHAWQFDRLLKDEKLFISTQYKRTIKTDSSAVKFKHQETFKLGIIDRFLKILYCQCRQSNCYCDFTYYAIIKEVIIDGFYTAEGDRYKCDSSGFYQKCHESSYFMAIPIENLITLCVTMNINGQLYFVCPINNKELE